MADIIKFNVTCEDLLKMALKAKQQDDMVSYMKYLRQALQKDPKFSPAAERLAEAYASLDELEMSNDVLFSALNQGVDEDCRARMFMRLSFNYANMRDIGAAEYYLREYCSDEEFFEEYDDLHEQQLLLVHPRGEEYYEEILDRAYGLVQERRFDEAVALVDQVDPSSQFIERACHIKMICFMLKDNLDGVIEYAKEMLAKKSDSVVIKCTLATAYMMEGRDEEALAEIDDLTSGREYSADELSLLMPLLTNYRRHADIEKFSRLALIKDKWDIDAMIWNSVARYNLGQKDEAARIMRQVEAIYGDYSDAKFYLQKYAEDAEDVEYELLLPHAERMRRYVRLQQVMETPYQNFAKTFAEQSPQGEEVRELVEWLMNDGTDEFKELLLQKLALARNDAIEQFFRKYLVKAELTMTQVSTMLIYLLDYPTQDVNVNVVAHGRFKELRFFKPATYFLAPKIITDAIKLAITDIVYSDDEPNRYINRLFAVVDEIVKIGEDGQVIMTKKLQKISKLRSLRTVLGVLIGRTYNSDEVHREVVKRYRMRPDMYRKYYELFFGD